MTMTIDLFSFRQWYGHHVPQQLVKDHQHD